MSTTTPKLGLLKPEHMDETYQTILDLATNFQKLDDNAISKLQTSPVTGLHNRGDYIQNNTPSIGDYWGWVCTRAGRAAPKWTGLTSFTLGQFMIPTVDNGHVYECVQSGYSVVLEPTYPVTSGTEFQDIKGATTWQPSKAYKQQDVVFPTTDNGRFYVCVVAGDSANFEPTWATSNGITTNDGTVVWSSFRIAKWKEAGTSAIYRPFGKIE
ncbi:hypothetical protein [Paenibacillus illinoisensis]|uniref:Tail fiber protein n=1 Tax=Paenibacillus illinoisensis TaxID=59845 RepID=A0A2W0C6K9_9BACL|nr:hypothetical protein [Paenibacillus illinoisensis]PYY28383.1 Uncharacterized protein PIL02S_03539 [Paenibacillus illinoisensis]